MTDGLRDERAIWPLLMARVRALPEGDVLAFELEGCGIAIQKELERLRRELAEAKGGAGHVFEGGTPEAMRDARLRNAIFNCVEQHPTEPKIATWHYAKALQLISDYRAELAEARAIGEQSRITKVEAAMLTDAMRYPDNGALHCRWCSAGPREGHESRCWYAEQVRRVDAAKQLADRLSARAATGEPKEAT